MHPYAAPYHVRVIHAEAAGAEVRAGILTVSGSKALGRKKTLGRFKLKALLYPFSVSKLDLKPGGGALRFQGQGQKLGTSAPPHLGARRVLEHVPLVRAGGGRIMPL